MQYMKKPVRLEHICLISNGYEYPDEASLAEIEQASLRALAHFLMHETIESQKSLLFLVPPGIIRQTQVLCGHLGISAEFRPMPIAADQENVMKRILEAREQFSRVVVSHLASRIFDMPERILEEIGLTIPTTSRKLPAGGGYRLSLVGKVFKDLRYGCVADVFPSLLVSFGNLRDESGEKAQEEKIAQALGVFSLLAGNSKPVVFCSKAMRKKSAAARKIAHSISTSLGCRLLDEDKVVRRPEFPLGWGSEGPRIGELYRNAMEMNRPAAFILPAESFINLPTLVRQSAAEPLRAYGTFSCSAPAGKAMIMLSSPFHVACREFCHA